MIMNESVNKEKMLQDLKFKHVEAGQKLEKAEDTLRQWDGYKTNLTESAKDLQLLTLRLMLIVNSAESLRTQRAALELASKAKNFQWMLERMFLPDEFEEEWRTHDVEVRRLNLEAETLEMQITNLGSQLEKGGKA